MSFFRYGEPCNSPCISDTNSWCSYGTLSWDYCSQISTKETETLTIGGAECKNSCSNHGGTSYYWCNIDKYKNWDYCSPTKSPNTITQTKQFMVRYALVIVLQTAMDTRHVLIGLDTKEGHLIIVLPRRVRHIGMNFVQMNADLIMVTIIIVTQIMGGIIVPQNSKHKQTQLTQVTLLATSWSTIMILGLKFMRYISLSNSFEQFYITAYLVNDVQCFKSYRKNITFIISLLIIPLFNKYSI